MKNLTMKKESGLEEDDGEIKPIVFRVAIVGAHRIRVGKVVQILQEENSTQQSVSIESTFQQKCKKIEIRIEYLSCVASFDSYNDESGTAIRYLTKIEYHGSDGTQIKGSSLAPFFDTNVENRNSNSKKEERDEDQFSFPGIAAVSIGCGIHDETDIQMIRTFFESLKMGSGQVSHGDDSKKSCAIECIAPNAEHSSMKEENEAYKNLDMEGKRVANESRSIGPGKMANFSYNLAKRSLQSMFPPHEPNKEEIEKDSIIEMKSIMNSQHNVEEKEDNRIEAIESQTTTTLEKCDEEKIRYACKICRTILFGEDHLENPPHTKSRHDIRMRKLKSRSQQSQVSDQCGSVFLASDMSWMGNGPNNDHEGRLNCPKCSSKVGIWKWAGTQCSCGTWVTPAFQVVLSKVDIIHPHNPTNSIHTNPNNLMSCTNIMNPLAGLYISSGNNNNNNNIVSSSHENEGAT